MSLLLGVGDLLYITSLGVSKSWFIRGTYRTYSKPWPKVVWKGFGNMIQRHGNLIICRFFEQTHQQKQVLCWKGSTKMAASDSFLTYFVEQKPGTWNIHREMVGYQLDDPQSLHRKWLEITKHLYIFINGCLEFQEYTSGTWGRFNFPIMASQPTPSDIPPP